MIATNNVIVATLKVFDVSKKQKLFAFSHGVISIRWQKALCSIFEHTLYMKQVFRFGIKHNLKKKLYRTLSGLLYIYRVFLVRTNISVAYCGVLYDASSQDGGEIGLFAFFERVKVGFFDVGEGRPGFVQLKSCLIQIFNFYFSGNKNIDGC